MLGFKFNIKKSFNRLTTAVFRAHDKPTESPKQSNTAQTQLTTRPPPHPETVKQVGKTVQVYPVSTTIKYV